MKKISEMSVAELRVRATEIRGLVDKPDADLEALDAEATEIAQRLQQAEKEARRKAIADKVRRQLLCNEFSPIEVVPQVESKTLNRIFTGYWLFDAGLENPTGAVKYTNAQG